MFGSHPDSALVHEADPYRGLPLTRRTHPSPGKPRRTTGVTLIGVLAVIAVGVAGAVGVVRGLLDQNLFVELGGAVGVIVANMWLVTWLLIAHVKSASKQD